MGVNKLIENQYTNISNLNDTLKKLSESYRLLIGGAFELNNIPEAKNRYVKSAVERADKLGDIIDDVIRVINNSNDSYLEYCKLVNDHIIDQDNKLILTEIDSDILLKNSADS